MADALDLSKQVLKDLHNQCGCSDLPVLLPSSCSSCPGLQAQGGLANRTEPGCSLMAPPMGLDASSSTRLLCQKLPGCMASHMPLNGHYRLQ